VNTYPPGGKVGAKEYEAAMAPLMKVQPAYVCLDDGYKALKKKDATTALSLAQKGLKIEPKEGHLYNLAGKAQVKLKQLYDALESFNKAIGLNPHYYDYYLERGQLKYQMGDSSGAKKDLDKSKEMLPSAEAYLTLGYIALDQGNRDEAIANFKVAAQADSPAGAEARAMLKKLTGES
jgi:tetratricopeptide (TPR) repeat protein